MIVEIMPTAGEWLAAGQTVVRVLRTDPLRVESFIDGHSQTADLVGHSLTFTPHLAQGAAAKSFVGTVVFVSPEIHPLTGQIRIRGEIPNPDGWLRPGMNGTLNIALERPDVQP